jgi:hypothetical protein
LPTPLLKRLSNAPRPASFDDQLLTGGGNAPALLLLYPATPEGNPLGTPVGAPIGPPSCATAVCGIDPKIERASTTGAATDRVIDECSCSPLRRRCAGRKT